MAGMESSCTIIKGKENERRDACTCNIAQTQFKLLHIFRQANTLEIHTNNNSLLLLCRSRGKKQTNIYVRLHLCLFIKPCKFHPSTSFLHIELHDMSYQRIHVDQIRCSLQIPKHISNMSCSTYLHNQSIFA